MIHRTFRYRLNPTLEQEAKFWQFAGVTRLVYNLALEQRRAHWRQYRAATGDWLNFVAQCREVTILRSEVPWIAEVHSTCLTQALRDLDRAFASFYAGRSGFPTPRKRGVNDSFRFRAVDTRTRRLNHRSSEVRIPKVGWIKYRDTRPIVGDIVNVTVTHDGLNWYICYACAIETGPVANDNPAIGIDRGIAQTIALSSGESINLPDLASIDLKVRRARRRLARCQRGSNRRRKQLLRLRRLAAKAANIRRDALHKASASIASRFGIVVLEDLNIKAMTASGRGKRGLNRSILTQGWGAFADMLTYKLEERGGTLVFVDPAYTSQTCSACGTVDRRNRESQAAFACIECGFRANADHNAAINILRRSPSIMPVEGRGCAPDEAGTSRMAA